MSEWRNERPGYRSKTIQNGPVTIIIHRPELSNKEAADREQRITEMLRACLKDCIHRTPKTEV